VSALPPGGVWPLLSAEGMRALDRHTIETLGIPGEVLMESAGRAAAAQVLEELPAGGEVLVVEATMVRGRGLLLTGQLGDVMKESARAAWSYARAHAALLGVEVGADQRRRGKHERIVLGAEPGERANQRVGVDDAGLG